jgi:hypothetical protein
MRFVRVRILARAFGTREADLDRYLERAIINSLRVEQLILVVFQQGWVTMAPALKEAERALLAKHAGHPTLPWHTPN